MDYIAPEQIRMPDDVGPAADIYALGCTLYFAVSGQVPFPGGTRREKMQRHLSEQPVPLRHWVPMLSHDFCRLVEAMMTKDPADRIRSAAEVEERLRRWTGGGPQPIPRLGTGAVEPTGRLPPPLPEEPLPNRAWLRWATQDSPVASPRRDDEVPWLLPDRAGTVELVRSMGPRLADWLPGQNLLRPLRSLAQAAILAVIGGLMFGGAMKIVEIVDPERFSEVMRGFGPAWLGLAAFGVILLAQLAVAQGGSRRRRS